MRAEDPVIRTAVAADLPSIARISLANDEPVGDPDRPGSRYLDHLLEHARLLVAEADGRIAGFAGAIELPMGWFLTDLFVDPPDQGHGIGRALLTEVLPAEGARLTFSSSDPRALPLYIRAGMAPRWPLLYLASPSEASLPTVTRQVWTVDAAEAAALERELGGHDRAREWEFWAGRPGARPFAIGAGGRAEAIGVAVPGQLVRLVLGPAVDAIEAVLAGLGATPGGRPAALAIPGPHPATRGLLERGWRIAGVDTHMSSGPDLIDPTRLLPDPSLA